MPDVAPTLNDTQVLEFCKQGYLMLEGVVPDSINRRVAEYLAAHPYPTDDGGAFEDDGLLQQPWFVDGVLLNPQAAGAVRSLLGRNPTLPTWMYNHQARSPRPAQGWHRDGCSRYGHALNHLQVFYYPQDTPLELGPTEVLPGSHFLFNLVKFMGHYRSISWAVHTAAPAGSIFLTVYSIWHRRPPSTAPGIRNMLKYVYWRMAPPEHDWIVEPDFNLDDLNDLENTHYHGQRPPVPEQFRDWHDVAEMFYWLRGKSHQFGEFLGTDGWPMGHPPRQRPREFHTYPENPALESTRP